mmetsp:Transcript_28623/g.42319  ORF Transcript_28623/g.42319 Transcript_28623/m.42319 type:complete len:428 (+) Transcript_28623:69-1352(+)
MMAFNLVVVMGTSLFILIVAAAFIEAVGAADEAASAYVNEKEDDGTYKFENLLAWVRHNGGRVDYRLGLTNHQYGDRSVRGGVALQNIKAGSELLFLPWNIVFGTIDDTATVPENKCEVLQSYASEVDAGSASFWYPYLALDDSLSSRVPSLWNELAILELQGLPPFGNTFDGITDWYSSNCADDVSFSNLPSSSRQALLAAITRAAGLRFLPVYDLLNHHNGMLNTKTLADTKGVTVTTTTDILKGEEPFMSIRGGQENTVSEMFRRYGFVEEWPRYHSLDQKDDESNGGTKNTMQFLILTGEIVAIYPPPSLLSQIGHGTLNIDDLLATAEKHNQGLSTEQLIQFGKLGVGFIDNFITTVEEDAAIIQKMKDNFLTMPQNLSGEIEQLTDIIDAIYYRIQFKQSIKIAADATIKILALRTDASEL